MQPSARRTLTGLLLLLAAGCGAAAIPWPGSSDVPEFWMPWTSLIREHGLVQGYALSFSDYTPLSFVFLQAMSWASDHTGISNLLLLKSGLTTFAWAGAFIFWLRSRQGGATAMFLFALVLVSSAQGYLDVLYLPPLLMSLWALERGRITSAAFWFAIATSMKWQPLIIAPFFVLAACRSGREDDRPSSPPWQCLLAGALPVMLAMVATFGPEALARSLLKALTHPALSYQALNPAWLVQWALADSRLPAGSPSYTLVPPMLVAALFKALFVATYGYLLHTYWRHGRDFRAFLWSACAGAIAYFTLSPGAHENHLFVALVLAFALLATGAPVGRPMAIYCALMLNLNLILFNGLNGRGMLFGGGCSAAGILACLINLAFLVACLVRAYRLRTNPPRLPPDAPILRTS